MKVIINKIFLLLLFAFLVVGCDKKNKNEGSTAAKNVVIIKHSFNIPGLNRQRIIRVYLPPNYQSNNDKYPVLYMHDGQNLFDDRTSFIGEWGVDESLNRLAKEKNFSIIVVGIDNGLEHRMNELSAWTNDKINIAEGEQYMNFIVSVVKSYIDSTYRTLSDQPNTGIMGSSMGGLISHYAIFKYPQVFSKAGIFSPSFWVSEEVFAFSDPLKLNSNSRLYYLMGSEEGDEMSQPFNKMINHLESNGFNYKDKIHSKVVDGGEHNETLWNSEFSEAILWLYSDANLRSE